MEEYAAKFVELSRFTPYLILDEPRKVNKFREGLNGRICPLIIASGVDTFTETIKRAMSLEEDFKCNLSSKKDEKKQEPFGFQHGEGQGQIRRRDSLKSSVMGIILMGKARVALLNLVRNGLAFVVVKSTRVKLAWKE